MEDDNEPTAASLNPEVLTSIIVSMRESLAEERKNFQATLADATAKNAALESRCGDTEERLHDTEKRLAETASKLADSEQSLIMLRQTLEESRRGIMRLQSESKRASINMGPPTPGTPSQTSRATKRLSLNPGLALPPLNSNSSNPRTPQSGASSMHRRISSMSDSSGTLPQDIPAQFLSSPSPNESTSLLPVVDASGGTSLLSTSPPGMQQQTLPDPEIAILKTEVSSLKSALSDAVDARKASEDVIRGLRELIAAHSNEDGVIQPSAELQGLSLPPLPSDPDIEDNEPPVEQKKQPTGWSTLRLWREQSNGSSTSAPPPPPSAPKLEHRSSSSTSQSSIADSDASSPATATTLGGFMSWRRGSSATSPQPTPTEPLPASALSAPPSSFNAANLPPSDAASSTASSFRSKFGFFSSKSTNPSPNPNANGETASLMSSRPTSIATSSEFHSPASGTFDRSFEGYGVGPDTVAVAEPERDYDEGELVQVVLPGDDEQHQEIHLHGDGKFDAMRGDMTPTVSHTGFAV